MRRVIWCAVVCALIAVLTACGGGNSSSSPPSTAVTITLFPTSTSFGTGATQQFTATVTNSTNIAVTWQVNGVNGGNTTVGLISSTGLYTAPNALPTPPMVTVTAISQADTTKTAAASVTITAATTGHSIITTFSNAENPISDGNTWFNGGADGLDWSNVRTANGNAIGTQTNGGFNDSIALLKGAWNADQTAQATVFVNGPSGTYSPEVELFLRGDISPRSATGYEINFSAASGQYQQIVRWNGPLGNFTILSGVNLPSPLASGDVVKATIVGNVITVYRNGVQVAQVTDNTYSRGSPGIGFFHLASGDGQDALWGFTDFSASD